MLRRYVALEIVVPFAAWMALLCVLLFVMAFMRGSEILLGSAVTLGDFARFTLYLLPSFLVQALPIAFLLAILLGLGRLVEDRELRAMQALGVSPGALFGAPVALGVVLSAALAVLMASLQPWGQSMVRWAANDIIRRNLMHDVKPGLFHEELLGFTLYVEDATPDGRWRHVMVHDGRDPRQPLLVLAKAGGVRGTEWSDAVAFELSDGRIHRAGTEPGSYEALSFAHASLRAGIGESLYRKNQFQTSREEQTPGELLEAIADADGEGEDSRPLRVTFHWRLGQMLMPLAFAFLGAPLAILRRGGRGAGVLFTLVGYAAYYVVARLAVQLADAGALWPPLAGQVANALFLALGAWLMWRVARKGGA